MEIDTAEYKIKAKQYLYYIIIGLVSVVFTCFLPMVGSEGDIVSHFPTTAVGWLIWAIRTLSTAVLNIVIFYCFMEQAIVNVKDDPKYKEANEILDRCKSTKRKNPRSPKVWKKTEYSKKGTVIFLSTAIALVGLENMLLSWNLALFLSYIFTILMGLLFGVLQMKKAELYWTEEFNEYAHFVEAQEKLQEEEKQKELKEDKKNVSRKKSVSKHSRTSRKEQERHS